MGSKRIRWIFFLFFDMYRKSYLRWLYPNILLLSSAICIQYVNIAGYSSLARARATIVIAECKGARKFTDDRTARAFGRCAAFTFSSPSQPKEPALKPRKTSEQTHPFGFPEGLQGFRQGRNKLKTGLSFLCLSALQTR